MPTIILFDEGIAYDRIVGFEDLGGEDDFPTLALTRLLVKRGIIEAKNKKESGQMKIRRGAAKDDSSDEEY